MNKKQFTVLSVGLVAILLTDFFILNSVKKDGSKDNTEIGINNQDSLKWTKSNEIMNSKFEIEAPFPYEGLAAAISYSINAKASEVQKEFARQMIETCPLYFRILDVPLPPLAARITTLALHDLEGIAKGLVCTTNCATETQTALRVYYGLDGNNKLLLFYQPLLVCLTEATLDQTGTESTGKYSVCKAGLTYTYNSSGTPKFDPFADLTALKTYTTNIRILKNSESTTYEGFVKKSDEKGDVESLVFSFDQIRDLCEIAGNSHVNFWNAVNKKYTQPPPALIKHAILLSTGNVAAVGHDLTIPSGAYFSNLAHICPPRCDDFTFKITN